MEEHGIKGLSPESIQSLNDAKTWARDFSIRSEARDQQVQAALADLKQKNINRKLEIARNLNLLLTASILFGCTLVFTLLAYGIPQIFSRFFDGQP